MSDCETELVTRAERELIQAFRAHWRRILIRHLDGDRCTEEQAAFLAGSPGARRHLADCFFSYPHACSLAILSEDEVRRCLQPWLRHAAEHVARELDPDDPKWEAALSALVEAPYVTVIEPLGGGDPLVMPYPGTSHAACYDDLYERTAAGCSVGARLFVYWSTGEPFGYSERRSTQAGIRNDFRAGAAEAADDEDWEIDFEDHDEHAVIAHICERMVDDASA